MATKEDEGLRGKERRGTSPSYPRTPAELRPKSTSQRTDPKHIPNYLKPTISSAVHPSKNSGGKKQGSVDTTHKPSHARRRSLEKPPSPSHLHKVITNSPNPKQRILRSSSFTSKSPKSLSKVPRDSGKHHSSYVKKPSTTPVVRRHNAKHIASETLVSGTTHETDNRNPESPIESSMVEDEKVVIDSQTNDEVLPADDEILILEDTEPLQDELIQKDVEVNLSQPTAAEKMDVENEAHIKETGGNHQEVVLEEHDHSNAAEHDEKDVEENNIDGKEDSVENLGMEAMKEGEEVCRRTEEKNDLELVANDNEGLKQEAIGKEKKDRHPVYNDVIEETASKLREQKKNKVKALAGAFETVISLQEPRL